MIDFNSLNPKKTYLGLQYGKSFVAKKIVKYSKIYAPNSEKIPTHVFALIFCYGNWRIYESHLKAYKKQGVPSGVRRYKSAKWLEIEQNNLNEFEAVEYHFSRKLLEEFIGQSYGLGDIKALMGAALLKNNGEQKDRQGLICSEYLALADKGQICNFSGLKPHCITPAHFQNFLDVQKG